MNSLSRYYIPKAEWTSTALVLAGEEAHHCVRVLRGKQGDRLEVFDGEGGSAMCEITSATKSKVKLLLLSQHTQEQLSPRVELCQSIPKGSNMEWIVQKSVELGVSSIQPLISENTVARAEQLEKKRLKWQRVALEACKQCGQNFLPVVKPVLQVSDWIKKREHASFELVAALDPRSHSIQQVLGGKLAECESIRLLIGPEGDFSQDEYDTFYREEMHFASIGEIVLKVETATMFCLSALSYEVGKR